MNSQTIQWFYGVLYTNNTHASPNFGLELQTGAMSFGSHLPIFEKPGTGRLEPKVQL
jgi:hypothetical protein